MDDISVELERLLCNLVLVRCRQISANEIVLELSSDSAKKTVGHVVRLYINSNTVLEYSVVDTRPEQA